MSKRKVNKAYVRVSTLLDSQKDSPEHQEAFIREHASRMGETIDAVLMDKDTATSIITREDIQKLISEAKRGDINSVWFASLSRFSRDTLDALSLKRILVDALGVRLISIEDGYDSGVRDDELLFGVKAVVNQNQSEQISIASKRGIRQSAAGGNYTGSIPPYGYKKVTIDGRKTLEVVPEQATVVKMIFDLYVNGGMGEKAIVNYLNGDEDRPAIPSYRGGFWGLSSVQRILQNENYTGYNVYGRHTTKVSYNDLSDLMNRGKKLVQKPKEQWERTDFQTHEAIISKELYEQAQDIRLLRGGGQRGGRRAFVNVFAKIMFCKDCGSAIVSMASLVRGKQYRYLMCSRRRRVGEVGCPNGKWIPYLEVRDDIIENVKEILDHDLNRKKKQIMADLDIKTAQTFDKKEKSRLEKVVASTRKLLFEIRRQHMLGEIDEEQYEFERRAYEKEIEESQRKLKQIEASEKRAADAQMNIKRMKEAINQLQKLDNYDDIEKTRALLLQIIKRIDVEKTGNITIIPSG